MKTVVLELGIDEALVHPMHAFVADHPAYGPTRLLQWNPHGFEANVLLFYVDGPREPFAEAIADVPSAQAVEPSTTPGEDGFYLFVKERLDGGDRALVESFTDGDLVVVPPIVYDTDRSMRLTVVGRSGAIQRCLDRTPDGATVSVRRIRSGASAVARGEAGLTDRQREVLSAALAAGYYEEPREATLDDVSERLDCGASTAAEHLRKAEAALVRGAVDAPE